MMTDKKNPPTITKPSSIKTRFAVKFLRAMKKLNNNDRPYSSSSSRSMSERQKRYRAIRAASHASMASAVGSRRAWSRAVLMKIRNRRQLTTYYSLMMNKRRRDRRRAIRRNNGIFLMRGNPSDDHRREDDGGLDRSGGEEEGDLRELVPGGEGMDFCRLLNETAHYIKCLRAQVQVMTNILDRSSS